MNTSLRTASVATLLTLVLPNAAPATTMRLVPLSPPAIGASIAGCAVPFASAAVADATAADLPPIAAEQNLTGTTQVRIVLDPGGRLTEKTVLVSSGNRWLDGAALAVARQSRYRAEVRDCAPVGGTYALLVDFSR